MARVSSSNRGFTLIELMMSVLILSVGLLGLLQVVNMSIDHNMYNQLRNEGVSVADAELTGELSKGFANVSANVPPITKSYTKTRLVMQAIQKSYSVTRSGSIVSNSKMVNVKVSWGYKNARYNVSVASVSSPPPITH